jgi:HD-GYP domain-containing protein (c-di-GMP phosphodiesterase class II)
MGITGAVGARSAVCQVARWVADLFGMNARARPTARSPRWALAVALSALMTPPATLLLLHVVPAMDLVLRSPLVHLIVVSFIAACALAVAVAAAAVAARSRDGSLVLLALGCLAIGFLMLGHGLVTPGIGGRPVNMWVGRLPVLALAVFAACLSAAAWPQGLVAALAGRWPRGTLIAGCAAFALVLMPVLLWPGAGVGARPLPGEAVLRLALVVGAAAALIIIGATCWRRWQFGHDSVLLAMVVASWLSAGALLSLQLGSVWHLAWWDYHIFLLAGFFSAVYGILTGYRRSRALHDVMHGTFATDPMTHITRGYSETLRALVAAVEARDAYTHGHSARVAELSVRIGLQLGLRPALLRTLAEGAYLHDIGKVGIPDHILNKPGALTPEERGWIQQHPTVGADIVGHAPSLRDALEVIRQHHERYGGGGYPDGLAGDEISLAARIVAVADVWDALTSDRAYRAAWPPDRALRQMEADCGTHFDPRCLDAFLAVIAEQGPRVEDGAERRAETRPTIQSRK